MKSLKVLLWKREIGRLIWNQEAGLSYFIFNPDLGRDAPEITHRLFPLSEIDTSQPIYGDERPIYQGLPPFISDSLPDYWGNLLFEEWIKLNKIPRRRITPLYKLMFIGTRAMGALEFQPAADDLEHHKKIDIQSLYRLSLKVMDSRDSIVITPDESLTLQSLLSVGTSAGGRQMKAILAINSQTGEIKSGQGSETAGFEQYILKFGNASMPTAQIEAAFYDMATASGIEMSDSRLLRVEGIEHFLTKRFDRCNGQKIHIQTLAALSPETKSYEDLVTLCRELHLPEIEIEQIFRRLVFNVLANNTDDHSKNTSFMLKEGEEWHLAPAYDMTFTFNEAGNGANLRRRLSLYGKFFDIEKPDLIRLAKENDIKNGEAIIRKTATTLRDFSTFATARKVTNPWRSIIEKSIEQSLRNFGLEDNSYAPGSDKATNDQAIDITLNEKGMMVFTTILDGKRQRRFLDPNHPLFQEISAIDINRLNPAEKNALIDNLFRSNQQ